MCALISSLKSSSSRFFFPNICFRLMLLPVRGPGPSPGRGDAIDPLPESVADDRSVSVCKIAPCGYFRSLPTPQRSSPSPPAAATRGKAIHDRPTTHPPSFAGSSAQSPGHAALQRPAFLKSIGPRCLAATRFDPRPFLLNFSLGLTCNPSMLGLGLDVNPKLD